MTKSNSSKSNNNNLIIYIILMVTFLSISVYSFQNFKMSLLTLENISEGQTIEAWTDMFTLTGNANSFATLIINNKKINNPGKFSLKIPLKEGKNHINIKTSFLFINKHINFTVIRPKHIVIDIPKYTDAPSISIRGKLNPDYTLITNTTSFKPDAQGNIAANIRLDKQDFAKNLYTLNIKVINIKSQQIYSDVFKIYIDKHAFANSLVKSSEQFFVKLYPQLKYQAADYNLISYDGSIIGIVSFNTNHQIDATEIVCSWSENGWEKIAAGTMMDIREELSSPDIFIALYNFKAWKRLVSTEVEIAVRDKFAKERDAQEEYLENEKQQTTKHYEVTLKDLAEEYLKYVGGNLKISGSVFSISEKFLTTDVLLTDTRSNYIHVRLYKRTKLKPGDRATFYGEIQGNNTSNIKGTSQAVVSLLATDYQKN